MITDKLRPTLMRHSLVMDAKITLSQDGVVPTSKLPTVCSILDRFWLRASIPDDTLCSPLPGSSKLTHPTKSVDRYCRRLVEDGIRLPVDNSVNEASWGAEIGACGINELLIES